MKVLMATDGSAHSDSAVDLLKRLPLPHGSEIVVLTVVDTVTPTFRTEPMLQGQVAELLQQLLPKLRQGAELLVQHAALALKESGAALSTEIREGHTADQILQACDRLRADLVVVGYRGLAATSTTLIGSVSHQILKHAPCSVLVARHSAGEPPRGRRHGETFRRLQIVLAFDGSHGAQAAVEELKRLPLRDRAAVTVLRVLPELSRFAVAGTAMRFLNEVWEGERQAAAAELGHVVQDLRITGAEVAAEVRDGTPLQEVSEVSRQIGADIVMLGSQGRRTAERFLLGSVSNHAVFCAPCSVWIVRRRNTEPERQNA